MGDGRVNTEKIGLDIKKSATANKHRSDFRNIENGSGKPEKTIYELPVDELNDQSVFPDTEVEGVN